MIVRYRQGEKTGYGLFEDGEIYAIESPFAANLRRGRHVGALEEVQLLAPCEPRSVIGAGGNFLDWYQDVDQAPVEPIFFLKATTCIVGPGAEVIWPEASGEVAPEGEVAIVIGKRALNLSVDSALDHVLGFTCANDVTTLDLGSNYFTAKCFDTFLPLGPWIAPLSSLDDLAFSCSIDGTVVHSSTMNRLLFGVDELIAAASRNFTLHPGDVILCGCPPPISKVPKPCTMTVEVESVGTLTNRLV